MAVSMERMLVVAHHSGDFTYEEYLAFEEWMEKEAVFMAERDNSPPPHDAPVSAYCHATGGIPF